MEQFDLHGRRIWVTGHRGMVGGAIVRRLQGTKCEVLTASRAELDLRDAAHVRQWIGRNKPDCVIIAAAKVGGILANNELPADFLYDNLAIATNVIHESHREGVKKLIFLGSSCIYPKFAPQPIPESALLTGPLEPTNEWYAIAKIAGIKLCQAYRKQHGRNYISAMPTNLYGPGDNYDLYSSHVLPALVRKFHEAIQSKSKTVTVWGTGTPLREFMHVDDLADAIVFLLQNYNEYEHINVGSREEISIADLAKAIGQITGFRGEIVFDGTKPDGTPRKLMDSDALFKLGWQPTIPLMQGIAEAYEEFRAKLNRKDL